MRVLIWLVEDTWEATLAEAAALIPPGAEITLLHVAPGEVEEMVEVTRAGLLGRHPRPPHEQRVGAVRAISEEAAAELLADAQRRLDRPARPLSLRGRIDHEVVEAAGEHDLLVMARDGDHTHLGPHSIGRQARFVLDHAPCRVLLVWPEGPPERLGHRHRDRR